MNIKKLNLWGLGMIDLTSFARCFLIEFTFRSFGFHDSGKKKIEEHGEKH